MSKQSEAKERQGYVARFVPWVCGNCTHRTFEMDWPAWMKDGRYELTEAKKIETNSRCGIGGFAVKKMGSCSEHSGQS